MMQHMSSEEHLPNAPGISQAPPPQAQVNGIPYGNNLSTNGHLHNVNWAHGLMPQDMFDSPLELNRRTLTQEHFDAMNRDQGMINGTGEFESFDAGFSGDQTAMNQVFPTYDAKQDLVMFPYPIVEPPLSSNDSTVPSIASEQSVPAFPSSHMMQSHASMSAADSDWADSRSSSLASVQHGHMEPMLPGQQQPQVTSSQWSPGRSVPVDVNDMQRAFQEAAAQAGQVRGSMEQPQAFEQPLAWPADEAYARRSSTASLLAQSMGSVGLHTPQNTQSDGVFKSPTPLSIAARRQRPKPANLGIASVRSQSYGGPGQPGSPGHQHAMQQGQSIRRAISSNVLNGGVAQGRVMKSVPGSAQRSPLNWTFAEAVNSPHFVRTMSQANLAPPTPMSPSHPNQAQQPSNWQDDSGQIGQHSSINETDEHGLAGIQYHSSAAVPPHVSPPHTPFWFQQQQYMPQRVASNVIMENTPPQSAPASQSCFPSNIFGAPPPSYQHAQQSQMAAIANSQQQQYLNLAVPNQQFHVNNVTFAPSQHADIVTSGPAPGMPLTFATGVPVMKDGNYQMSFPPQMQMMQPHQGNSPPQMPYAFVNSDSPSPMSSAQPPKLATQPANDFVVHEYSPPDSIKRSVPPRKSLDSGPKNYTFANAGPVDYEEKKARKADGKESSNSPASSSGTLCSS